MPEKTPQDRLPKANAPFTFKATVDDKDAEGKPVKKTRTFTLPNVGEDAASDIPGEITYAAVMEPDNDMVQMRLAFATLEAVKPSEAAMKALKSLPTKEMLEVIGGWMGESSGSSA